MQCPVCKKQVEENMRFCLFCGASLQEPSAPASAEKPAFEEKPLSGEKPWSLEMPDPGKPAGEKESPPEKTPPPEKKPVPEKTPPPEKKPVPEKAPLPVKDPLPEKSPSPEKEPAPEKKPREKKPPKEKKPREKEPRVREEPWLLLLRLAVATALTLTLYGILCFSMPFYTAWASGELPGEAAGAAARGAFIVTAVLMLLPVHVEAFLLPLTKHFSRVMALLLFGLTAAAAACGLLLWPVHLMPVGYSGELEELFQSGQRALAFPVGAGLPLLAASLLLCLDRRALWALLGTLCTLLCFVGGAAGGLLLGVVVLKLGVTGLAFTVLGPVLATISGCLFGFRAPKVRKRKQDTP